MLSKALGAGGAGRNTTALQEAMVRFSSATDAMKSGKGAGNMMDTMYDLGKMTELDQVAMVGRFGIDEGERLMSLGFANPKSRIIQQISKKFPGVKFTDPMQAIAVTEIANRVDKGVDIVDAVDDVRRIYGSGNMWWVIAAASGIGWGTQVPPGTLLRIPTDLSMILVLSRQ